MKKYLIIAISVSLLAAACGKQAQVQPAQPAPQPQAQTQPTDDMANWKTYTNAKYGFEVRHPMELTIKEDAKGVVFSHSVPYKHHDSCDLKGGAPVLKEVVDFNATLKVFNTDVESAVKATFSFPKDIIENGQFKLSPGFVDEYSSGSLKGYILKIGAEGCGVNTYYFPLNALNTLVVSQRFTAERTELITGYEKVLALPGMINPKDEDKIFNQLLSTFKFTNDETANWKTMNLPESKNVSFNYPSSSFVNVKDKNNIEIINGEEKVDIFYKADDRISTGSLTSSRINIYETVANEYLKQFGVTLPQGRIDGMLAGGEKYRFELMVKGKKEIHEVFYINVVLVDVYTLSANESDFQKIILSFNQ